MGVGNVCEAAVECCTELTTFEGYLLPCGTIVNARAGTALKVTVGITQFQLG